MLKSWSCRRRVVAKAEWSRPRLWCNINPNPETTIGTGLSSICNHVLPIDGIIDCSAAARRRQALRLRRAR